MSTRIFFVQTSGPTDEGTKRAVIDECRALAPQPAWWSEPINVQDLNGKLFGETNLTLSGWYPSGVDGPFVETDDRHDEVMECFEAHRAIRQFCDWARKHGISWDVVGRGDRYYGAIDAKGEGSPELVHHLAYLLEVAGAPNYERLAARAVEIDKLYAGREVVPTTTTNACAEG